jgi:hypothetical protein|tara:strand:- start:814 stop:1005 length:192 start_codon:yes stop_codon:yes gene_type:complete
LKSIIEKLPLWSHTRERQRESQPGKEDESGIREKDYLKKLIETFADNPCAIVSKYLLSSSFLE